MEEEFQSHGEISLAHYGVLFLDELPEFNKHTLEVMRAPLEDKKVTISRVNATLTYPCNCMFVASMNPCPCGFYGSEKECTCSSQSIMRYLGKISGPLLDRIDIHIEVKAVKYANLNSNKKEENSETLIESVKEVPENYYIYIGNNGKDAVVLDPNQNINIVYANGEIKNVTLEQYVGPDGEIYIKDNIRALYQGYIWHSTPVQISEKKVAYITNIPYFGYNLNKYIAIIDIDSNTHSTIWASKATEIVFEQMNEKGLEVNIDGNVRYITSNGELVQ